MKADVFLSTLVAILTLPVLVPLILVFVVCWHILFWSHKALLGTITLIHGWMLKAQKHEP